MTAGLGGRQRGRLRHLAPVTFAQKLVGNRFSSATSSSSSPFSFFLLLLLLLLFLARGETSAMGETSSEEEGGWRGRGDKDLLMLVA